ncbi:MAG: glutamine amidotransferase [Hyphomicrobiales bacterium]
MTLEWAPLIPLPLLAILALALVATSLATLLGRKGSVLLRLLAGTLLIVALANPSIVREEREKLKDVAVLLIDRSGSQSLSVRETQTNLALAEVKKNLATLPNLDVRVVETTPAGENGTRLFAALESALSDVPPERIAGAILVTDGIIHDIPNTLNALGFRVPLHTLITGLPAERDRRIELLDAPRFGIVGKQQTVRLRVTDNTGNEPVLVKLRRDGKPAGEGRVQPGQTLSLPVQITHSGANVIELEAEEATGELTGINNKATIIIDGVRDKMRVLLVSGEPNPGERTWRNTLKSDASVELIHFTILRPPEKQDGTPVSELSLIAFPTRELFETKIDDFDLIIFDRYTQQSILPSAYLQNIVRYVRNGGALFVSAGPEFAGPDGLAGTPLQAILPATPDGQMAEKPFRPQITEIGAKHPVTRTLPGSGSPPEWGEWTRQILAQSTQGSVVMSGDNAQPLLVLNREGKGRVALLLSDHAWLWARNFRGGGPYLDLLRNTVHWLMKEPQLEEEALRASAKPGTLVIERRTMADNVGALSLTSPSGAKQSVTLEQVGPGLWRREIPISELGLYRVDDGALAGFASVGPANPLEFQDVLSSTNPMSTLSAASGGSIRRIAPATLSGSAVTVILPSIIRTTGTGPLSGSDFIALRDTRSSVVRGTALWPLLLGLAGLTLLLAGLLGPWLVESRLGRGRRL